MSYLRLLYQEMILDHSKYPRNFGDLPTANHSKQGFNPLCGDKVEIFVREEKSVLLEVSFQACGCAISVASASMMTEVVLGKTYAEFDTIFADFHTLVTQTPSEELIEKLGKLAVLAGVFAYPARVKCATLAWHTLRAALKDENIIVSTE
jgi:nitrogen fixation NifU-like protein